MSKSSASTIAYSYVRFSHPDQAKGDSLRRQTEAATEYCRRKGWTFDRSLTLADLGVSAFRGDNALVGNLRTFLDAIDRGTVLPGSVLIVENVDRISRQGIDEGYDLCKKILKSGVHLVTLTPEREFGPEAVKSLTKGALELQLILERAAEESETKSQRVGSAWAEKRRRAKDGETQKETTRMGKGSQVLTRQLPGWVKVVEGKPRLRPGAKVVFQRIYVLALSGHGSALIAQRLNAEGVPPWGRSGAWSKAYVMKLLRDRRTRGDFQPLRGGEPDGEVIRDYFPAVYTEQEWSQLQAAAGERRRPPSRVSARRVNIFSGLLRDARTGGTYCGSVGVSGDGVARRKLVTTASTQGLGSHHSFPFGHFEEAVLTLLSEIKPHEVLGEAAVSDEVTELSTQLTDVLSELADVKAFLQTNRFNVTIGEQSQVLENRKRKLAADLAEAKQRAENPVGEALGELKSLAGVLESAPDPEEMRRRIRLALRCVVEEAWILVIPRGLDRLCALQLFFRCGTRRDYLIFSRPARANGAGLVQESKWWARSFAEVVASADLDLRRRADAKQLEAFLTALDLQALAAPRKRK